MKEKLLNATLATMLIITLTMANFIILGVNVVTYASELLHQTSETNYKNVEFTAYFKTDSGDKIDMAQTPINTQDLKLYMQIAVKEEGYFNGILEVANSNFTVNQEKLSNAINKIEGNTITLNQINAGQTVEVEVGITPTKEDSIDQGLLSAVTNVNLTGTYVSGKEKETKIESTKNVQLLLQSPYTENEGIKLSSEIITNKLYKVTEQKQVSNEETTKRMVQVKIRSGLDGNKYPIKATNLKLTVPEGVENIEVSSQGTKATNGKTELSWEEDKENKTLNIKIENTPSEEGKIAWTKSGEDIVVVTYILPEEAKVTNTNIEIADEIILYNNTETKITGSATATILEQKDGTIEFEETSSETSIYKGKIYAKEERTIKTNTNIYVNYENQTEGIKIVEKPAAYVGKNEIVANVQYKVTSINKEQMISILGEEGYIKISNEAGEEIITITNATQADENGNIVVNYTENVKTINVETSQPKAKGKIVLKHIKTIKPEEYTREIIRNVNTLKQEISATYNKELKTVATNVELKETETKANLGINNNTISTQRETEIELRATLKANKEEYDLYKNPTVKIQLPQEVTSVNVSNINLLYEDEMKIANAQYDEKTKTIIINLQGEQTKYHTDLNEGAQIYIAAKVSVDELTPSKKSEITFTYSNENSISGEQTEKLPIKIESKYGLMLYSKVLNYNDANETAKTIDSQVPVAQLDVNKASKTATMNLAVLNNYETTLTNVSIVGRIPNGTFETALAQEIKTNTEGVKVYYSADINADANNESTWTDNVQNYAAVKSYKIVLNQMQPEQVLKFAYTFRVPESLGYNQIANASFNTTYTYVEKEMTATSSIQLKTQEKKLVQYLENNSKERAISQVVKETKTEEGLAVQTLVTTSGGENKVTLKEGDSVYEGQTLHYTVKVTNNTGADLSNVKATVTQTNAVFYGERVETFIDVELKERKYTYYEELKDTEKVFIVETLENGQSKTFEYEVVIKEVEGENQTTQGTMKLSADNLEEITENTIVNKIKTGKIKLNTTLIQAEEQVAKTAGGTLPIAITVSNISESPINDLIVEIPVNNSENFIFNNERIEDNIEMTEYEDVEETENTEDEEDEKNSIEVLSNENNIVKLKIKDTIQAGKSKSIGIYFDVKYFETEKETIDLYCLSTLGDEIYTSNVYSTTFERNTERIEETTLKISQTSDPVSGSTLKDGDLATYTVNIENNGDLNAKTLTNIELPFGMEMQKITVINNGVEEDVTKDYINNESEEVEESDEIEEVIESEDGEDDDEDDSDYIDIEDKKEKCSIYAEVAAQNATQVKVLAKLNTANLDDKEELTNSVNISDMLSNEIINVNSITYYAHIEVEEDNNQGNGDNNNNNSNSNNGNNSDNSINEYTITGLMWIDENRNGLQDDKTSKLDSVEIRAIDSKGEFAKNSKGEIITSKTSEDGEYQITLPEGKYMLIFMYDTGKYELTTYNTSKEDGSAVVDKTITIDENQIKVAATDLLTVNNDIKNINIGLIEKENFTLSLNKSISKVTVQNKGGTKTTQYNNTQLAKTEIRAKYFSGTTILVEYKIDITNNGDVDGYVNDVVDYIPAGYKFSSDLNNTWYESTDKNLHNNSLANEKIKVGETKTLTLVLTKTLTENDTGLIVNTAEIANSSSVSGTADVNSTVNNKQTGEDDISSANLLVSVSTGLKTACITGIIISFILVGLCVYMIKRGEGE